MDIRTHEMLVLPLHLRQRTGDLSTHPIGGPPSVLTTDRRTTSMTVVLLSHKTHIGSTRDTEAGVVEFSTRMQNRDVHNDGVGI